MAKRVHNSAQALPRQPPQNFANKISLIIIGSCRHYMSIYIYKKVGRFILHCFKFLPETKMTILFNSSNDSHAYVFIRMLEHEHLK